MRRRQMSQLVLLVDPLLGLVAAHDMWHSSTLRQCVCEWYANEVGVCMVWEACRFVHLVGHTSIFRGPLVLSGCLPCTVLPPLSPVDTCGVLCHRPAPALSRPDPLCLSFLALFLVGTIM